MEELWYQRLPATARLVEEPEAVERGLRAFLTRSLGNTTLFGVVSGSGRLPNEEDPARAAHDDGTVVVEIVPDRRVIGRLRGAGGELPR